MFNRRTTIPNLLGATLALTGCGGDPPPRPTSMWGAATEAFCMKLKICDPSYDDQPCREDVPRDDFFAQYLSEECDALFASYSNCVTALSCDVLLRITDYDLISEELDACFEEFVMDSGLYASCYAMLPPIF